MRSVRHGWLLCVLVSTTGCVGTTGGDLLDFEAYAAGPADARKGEPYAFVTGRGYTVTLEQARIRIGAVYMNRAVPTSVGSDTSCALAGIYVAEVTEGFVVDALSPALQPFPSRGFATSERARTGEVWLTGGDVNAESDPAVIIDVHGVAEREGQTYPFEAALTISKNRVMVPSDPATPGAKPICKQRIVTPIPIDITPSPGGHLVLRVDPRGWFSNVDFAELPPPPVGSPRYRFADDASDAPSRNLFGGIRASTGVYSFSWEANP